MRYSYTHGVPRASSRRGFRRTSDANRREPHRGSETDGAPGFRFRAELFKMRGPPHLRFRLDP